MQQFISQQTPLFCDIGPYAGMTRIDITGKVYLTREEMDEYYRNGCKISILITGLTIGKPNAATD